MAATIPAPRTRARRQRWRRALLPLVAALGILAPGTVRAAAPATDWWDTHYAWRRKITFTDSGTGTPTGTVVSFTFDHASLVSSGKSLAGGDDVRVAYWDGAAWTELPRSLANGSAWNNAATQIMVKTAADLAVAGNSDNYYLYFGNAAAAAPPTAVPTARWYKAEQLVEQSTASTTFVNVPGTTLTFTPGDTSETWLVFVSGIMRSSSTNSSYTAELQLLINGTTVDYWGHRTNNATPPNSAGFLIPVCITGTAATQTIQPQFRAAIGTSYVNTIRVVAALVPPGADLHQVENSSVQRLTGSNLSIASTTFTPPGEGDYLILGKVSHHENPGTSTVQSWVDDDAGTLRPDAPVGTHYSEGYTPWVPATTVFRRTLTAASHTFTLRGKSSNAGAVASEWRYPHLIAVRMDAWEAAEYDESPAQSTTTSTTFQTKVSLTTAAPPAARDYLVIQAQRMSGNSTSTTSSRSGELRDDGMPILRTDHRIGLTGSATAGYHHTAGVANVKRTAASVTYDNGYLSPNGITVQCADSSITSLRYREAASALGADEPVPTVTWMAAAQTVAENGGSITLTAQLSAVKSADVTVPFTVTGTAANGTDYTITASPLTIATGDTTAGITINILDDPIAQFDHTIVITMGTPTGAAKGATTVHTVTIGDDDAAGVTVSKASVNIAEGGATDTYTIVLNTQPTANVVLTVTPDSQSDVGAGAGVTRQITFTAANWSVAQTVTVAATDDPDVEGQHASTITHTASSADTFYNGIVIADVAANIADNDTAGVLITESSGSTDVVEGGATDNYTVVLRSRPVADVVITVTPDAQSSVGLGAGISRQLVFTNSNWYVPQAVTVAATDDPDVEGPHTSPITHTATSADTNYGGITIAGVTAHIADNDAAGVTVSKATVNVTEGGVTDTYTVALNARPTASVTVTVEPDAMSSVGAGSGVARLLTFTSANWNVTQTVTVTATDDAIAEGLHTSTLAHTVASADPDYNGIAAASVTANITDNDIACVNFSLAAQSAGETAGSVSVDVTLSLVSNHDVTVPFTLGGTANAPANYTITPSPVTIPAGQLSKTITIHIIDDVINNPDRTVILTLGNPGSGVKGTQDVHTLTILDDEPPGVTVNESGGSTIVAEAGATDSYTIALQSQPLADVTIAVNTDGKTTVNPATLIFTAANWNTPQMVTVTAVDDLIAQGPRASVATHTAMSTDIAYDNIAIGSVTVTILDNDTAGVTITQSSGSTDVAEGGQADTYTVALHSQPMADVTVTMATDGRTNTSPTSLTFTPGNWNAPQAVTVTAADDATAEGPHTSSITHTATGADPVYTGMPIACVVANITDNDTAGVIITESAGRTDVTEGGTIDTYTIVLRSQPLADVTITPNIDGTVMVNPALLTFTPGTWNVPRTVTVTAVDDIVAQGPRTAIIPHAAASADGPYNGVAIASVTVHVTDNDAAGVMISQAAVGVTEGGATDMYTVALRSPPTADVTIHIATDGSTIVDPAQLTFTAADWNGPQAVTVTAVDDAIAQGARASSITHAATSSDSHYSNIAIQNVTASITDNDSPGVIITESGGSTNVTEGGATDAFTVVLLSEPTSDVTVTISGDGQVAADPGSLIFTAANWRIPRTVTVTAVDDAVAQGSRTSTIHHAATSADPNYSAVSIASVTVHIADKDSVGATVSRGAVNVTEGGATDTYAVVLNSQPAADVTITATSDTQTTASPASLTFTAANWNTAQVVTVTATDDAVAKGLHTSTITHSAASRDVNYDSIAVASVTVNITDNDTAGVLVAPTSGLETTAGGAATFTVVLRSQPTANVTIGLASENPAAGAAAPTMLTFTPANWNMAQAVTVTGVNNPLHAGDVPYTIVTAAADSADPAYNGLDVPDVSVINRNGRPAGISIYPPAGLVIDQAGGIVYCTIALDCPPTADVTIELCSSDPTQGTVSPSSVTFTSASWNVPQTITVQRLDLEALQGTASFQIVAGPAASADPAYNAKMAASVPVTNERSNEYVQIEIQHLVHHGVCGPIGCVPLALAIPGLLGMRQAYGRARRTRPQHPRRN